MGFDLKKDAEKQEYLESIVNAAPDARGTSHTHLAHTQHTHPHTGHDTHSPAPVTSAPSAARRQVMLYPTDDRLIDDLRRRASATGHPMPSRSHVLRAGLQALRRMTDAEIAGLMDK